MFDGKNVIDWSFRVTQYMASIDITADDESQLKFAVNLLTGRALTWWRHHLMTSTNTFTTWLELRDALYNEFVDIDHVNKVRDQLEALTMSKCGSVAKFINKFRELQLELGPHAFDNNAALHKFINGLHGPIRMHVSMADPDTLPHAFKLAERCEAHARGTTVPTHKQ
jgi:hypothetical protein